MVHDTAMVQRVFCEASAAVSGVTLLMTGERGTDVRPVYFMRNPFKYS